MAYLLRDGENVRPLNQFPPQWPLSCPHQWVQYLENGHVNETMATTLNQDKSAVQKLLKGKLKALGITEIVTGTIIITVAIIQISIVTGQHREINISTRIGAPWWTGISLIISGILAALVQEQPSHCLIRGCLAMNIISAISCSAATAIYSVNLFLLSFRHYHSAHSVHDEILISILLLLTLLNVLISIAISIANAKINCARPKPVIVVYNGLPAELIPQQQFHDNPPPYNVAVMQSPYVG
ncbi:membrane-spanning 4-domains subfamily A member 4A-like [Scyliorhinus canicula]|uniref:membrane-spanning 4-domains subfamily A member 4A-like n=1 Tax=Scyliorhinus canicula TaxID=7830 RepID=UPI0018F47EBA|nr:membrane-spanning 4-domains subfamily A member 4A-like [Scyliorhinus canicula]